jgi:hypothetical protein
MKKTAILILTLFFSIIANCQTWAPVGAKWTYTEFFFGGPGNDTMTIRSIGDTLIQGKICRILEKNSWLCDIRSTKEYTYEDSGKVYFYDNFRNTFQMLYNFNSNVGDTYAILPGTDSALINDTIKLIVDSVSTTMINSTLLKKVFVHQTNFNFWYFFGGSIIEDIGDLHYMFPWDYGGCDANFARPLRCYSDSIIGFYDFGTAPSCDYVDVGIKENLQTKYFSSFPNPSSGTFLINFFDNSDKNILIYNLVGDLVFQREINGIENEIEIRNLMTGMYILKVICKDWTGQEKIIKE